MTLINSIFLSGNHLCLRWRFQWCIKLEYKSPLSMPPMAGGNQILNRILWCRHSYLILFFFSIIIWLWLWKPRPSILQRVQPRGRGMVNLTKYGPQIWNDYFFHFQAESTSDLSDHILPVFIISFFASLVNSFVLMFKKKEEGKITSVFQWKISLVSIREGFKK